VRCATQVAIREVRAEDWEAIRPCFRAIVAVRETYAHDPAIGKEMRHGYVGLRVAHRPL
jgi:hypothetical protein